MVAGWGRWSVRKINLVRAILCKFAELLLSIRSWPCIDCPLHISDENLCDVWQILVKSSATQATKHEMGKQSCKYQVHGARKKEKGDRALVKDKVRSKNRKVDCLLRHSFWWLQDCSRWISVSRNGLILGQVMYVSSSVFENKTITWLTWVITWLTIQCKNNFSHGHNFLVFTYHLVARWDYYQDVWKRHMN